MNVRVSIIDTQFCTFFSHTKSFIQKKRARI